MGNKEFAKELWTICNAVVAFIVVQTVSFTILCTTNDFRHTLAGQTKTQLYIVTGIMATTLIGCFIIYWCSRQICLLEDLEHVEAMARSTRKRIVRRAGWGRIVLVILLFIPAVWALSTVDSHRDTKGDSSRPAHSDKEEPEAVRVSKKVGCRG